MTVRKKLMKKDFSRGELVVTPLGKEARVIGEHPDGRIELLYCERLNGKEDHVALLPRLLRVVGADPLFGIPTL